MQKKFLAVAVALVSIPALGQLSMYGTVDVGLQELDLGKRADGKDVSIFRMTSGLLSTPRLGFKGENSLGMYGLHAGFQLETGFGIKGGFIMPEKPHNFNPAFDSSIMAGNHLFTRQARVYVSGSMGELSFGLQPTPYRFIESESDVTRSGMTMTSMNLFRIIPYTDYADNSIAYHTPEYNGLAACFLVSTSDAMVATNALQDSYMDSESGRVVSASLEYSTGPLYVGAGFFTEESLSMVGTPIQSPGHSVLYLASVSYDFGVAKPYVAYFSGRNYGPIVIPTGTTPPLTSEPLVKDATVFSIGVSVPAGDYGYVLANFATMDEMVSEGGAYLFGIGYAYSFNRSSTVYAGYSTLSNSLKDSSTVGQGLTLNGALMNSPAVPMPTSKPQSFEVGFRYRF